MTQSTTSEQTSARSLSRAKSVGPSGRVIAFEPLPKNADHYRLTNVRLLEFAASDQHLVESGDLGPPRFVKIDVEGAEGSVLKGMRRTVAAAKPVLFIECSEAGRATTWSMLREFGYRCQSAITRRPVHEFEEYRHSDFLWLPTQPQSPPN